MRERHWTQLSDQLGFKLNPDKSFTLKKAEEMKLMKFQEMIVKASADFAYCISSAMCGAERSSVHRGDLL